MCSSGELDAPHGSVHEIKAVASASATTSRVLQAITEYRELSSSSRHVVNLKQRRWQVLLFGQAVALSAASVNASSYTLQDNLGVVLPIFQMAIMYFILSTYLCCRSDTQREVTENGKLATDAEEINVESKVPRTTSASYTLPFLKIKLQIPWWIYLGISILDVEANYMVLLSLQYVSLTSTTLLGSLTVPSVMICSRYLLARVLSPPHYIGVCLCLLGGTIMVWSDLGGGNDVLRSNSCIGDVLAICAALLYGLGDTVAEYAIKHIDREEYLGMIGFFGFLISSIQFVVLEWDALLDLLYSTAPTRQRQAVATMMWYIASLVLYYVTASYFLLKSDATLLNLSLQTTSLWACMFSVVADGIMPPPVFFVAAVLVASGVCIYEIWGKQVKSSDGDVESSDDEFETLTYTATRHRQGQGYMSIETNL